MTRAKVRIEGEDATGAAWSSAIGRARGAADEMRGMFEATFAGVGLAGIAAAGNSALEYGAQVERASETTKMTSRAVQELGYAAQQVAGVDLPTVTTSITFMEKAISEAASGLGEQKKAMDALGLSMKDLQGLSPDRQFELIGERISELKDPTDRARAAADLLGRSWQEIGPLFAEGAAGIEKLRTEADKLGIALNDEQIKRLDAADKSVSRLAQTFGRLWDSMLAGVAGPASDVMNQLAGQFSGDKLMQLQAQLDLVRDREKNGLFGSQAFSGIYQRREKELEDEIARLTNGTSDRVGTISRPGELSDVSVTAQRIGAPPGFQTGPDPLQDVQVTATKIAVDAIQKAFDDMSADTRTELERQTDTFLKKMDELDTLLDYHQTDRGTYMKRAESAVEELPAEARDQNLDTLIGRGSIDQGQYLQLMTTSSLSDLSNNMKAPDFSDSFKQGTDKMTAIAEQAGRNIENAFAKEMFDPFKGGVRGMLTSFLETIQKMLANEATVKLFSALGKWGTSNSGSGGIVGGIAGIVGSMFGGGKAGGGDVSGGTSYLVGEDGPEIFTPSAHGVITPNGALGGNVTVQMGDTHIHAGGGQSPADLAAMLPPILEAHAERTKADLLNAFRRSGLAAPNRA